MSSYNDPFRVRVPRTRTIRRPQRSGSLPIGLIAVGVIVVGLLVWAGIAIYGAYSTVHKETATVCSKESVPTGSGSSSGHEYRVYTDKGTFKVTDHIVNGFRTTSADTYGHLQNNTTYQITYYGWRNGFMSMFPNILDAKRLPDNQQQPHACDGS
ncbi:MAG TPA: DUF1523 family protein [Candidatus Saccharimonadales bacterium]|nr:DUF1523 family protein [Candidatus Saccharimonadales bacterium]